MAEDISSDFPTLASQLQAIPKSGRIGAKLVADLLEGDEAAPLSQYVKTGMPVHGLLAGIAEGSPFLWRLIQRDPVMLNELLGARFEHSFKGILDATAASAETGNTPRTMQILRRMRMRSALLIGLGDLGGVFDTVAVTRALSDFADASVAAALRFALRAAETAGSLRFPDPARPEQGLGLFVLAAVVATKHPA